MHYNGVHVYEWELNITSMSLVKLILLLLLMCLWKRKKKKWFSLKLVVFPSKKSSNLNIASNKCGCGVNVVWVCSNSIFWDQKQWKWSKEVWKISLKSNYMNRCSCTLVLISISRAWWHFTISYLTLFNSIFVLLV